MQQADFILKCCVCGDVRTENGWQRETTLPDRSVPYSHTYCTGCFETTMREFGERVHEPVLTVV